MGKEIQKPQAQQHSNHQVALRSMLTGDKMKAQFAAALPKHLSPERFVRVALTALNKTPLLADCTQESFFKCLLDLSAMGLEPDGRRAHLIPFKDNRAGTVVCTLIPDYKGLVELAMRSGAVSNIYADVVCEADVFEYDKGQVLTHKINFRKDRGEPYAAYAIARFKDGSEMCAAMGMAEILRIRDGSQGWKAYQKGYAKSSPWADYPEEMAKKTVFKRLSKWLPLSPEFRDAVDVDDEGVIDISSMSVALEQQQDEEGGERRKALIEAITKAAEIKGMNAEELNAAVIDGTGFQLDEMDDAMLSKAFAYVTQLPENKSPEPGDLV